MKSEFQSLPSSLASRFSREVSPDEQVLLVGQPVARGGNKLTRILSLSALFVLIGFPLFINVLVPETGNLGFLFKCVLYVFFALCIPMCVVLLFSPLVLKRMRKKSAYVITNKRVIALYHVPFLTKIRSYNIEPGMIEQVNPHCDGGADVTLSTTSGRGCLRAVSQFRLFIATLGSLGVHVPSPEHYSAQILSSARMGIVKQLVILLVLALFCTCVDNFTNLDEELRASGVRTEARIVGVSEEKQSVGRISTATIYRPIVLFTTPDGKQHWESLGVVGGVHLSGDAYNRPSSIGKTVNIIYNPAKVSDVIAVDNSDPAQDSLIQYLRYVAYVAIGFTVLMLLGEIKAWLFGQSVKKGEC